DIYACGIILYQLLAGELPFQALTTRQMIMKQASERPRPLKEVKPDVKLPEGLESVVMRALAKEKNERYQSAEGFMDALGQFVARFQREAQVSAKFKHPNAIEIYDSGKVGSQLFMAMEFVEGKPLTRRMRGEGPPIGLTDTVEVFCQVLDVLDAAHRNGIVHR